MTTRIPVKAIYDGSNVTALGEFISGDVVSVAYGGTGADDAANARINLEVDTANIRNKFSASGSLSYSSGTGVFSSTANVVSVNGLTGTVTLTTANIAESGNLYFTNTRAINAFTEGAGINIDSNGLISSTVTGDVASVNGLTGTVVLSTANIAESGNLYFTNTRAISAFTEGTGINIDSNGLISSTVTGDVASVNGLTGTVTLTTANIAESGNLYFTNARSIAALSAGQSITIDANGRINSTATGGGGAVDSVNGLTGTVVLSTANIAESGNLYFTNTRVVAALTAGQSITIDANGRINSTATGGGAEGVTDQYARTLAIIALG